MHCFNLVNLIIFALVDFSNGQLDLSQTAIHIFIQFPKHFNRLLDPFLPLDYDAFIGQFGIGFGADEKIAYLIVHWHEMHFFNLLIIQLHA